MIRRESSACLSPHRFTGVLTLGVVLVLAAVFAAYAATNTGPEGIGATYARDFDSGFTNAVVARGRAQLDQCTLVPRGPQRFECVSDALYSVASQLGERPGYRPTARIFRDAAAGVRAAKTLGSALSTLETARKRLLRATGLALEHHKLLSTLMTKAKSVLRS